MLSQNSPEAPRDGNEPEAGFALIAVIGLILIVSAVLLPFSISARVRALTAENVLRTVRYENIGKGLMRQVAEKISDMSDLRFTGSSACTFGDLSISLEIQDHSGLIDLNAAGIPLLSIGFQALGFPKEKASSLALATDYYRRMDSGTAPQTANSLMDAAGYKHASFEDVLELQDFHDLQEISPSLIASVFTVQSGNGTISLGTAPEFVKTIIGLQQGTGIPIVGSHSRPQVVSIFFYVFRHGNLEYSAASIFRISQQGAAYMGPLQLSLDALDTRRSVARKLPCAEMVGPQILAALTKVL